MSESTETSSRSESQSALAAAAERRLAESSRQKSVAQISSEYEKRQKFRRMIDPGIIRPNADVQAEKSLKTLLTIADNLIREPKNEKYRKIKPTNVAIKRDLMDPKGTVEYLREMGFYPQVENFQPYYVFNPRFTEDLHLGATMLKEYLDLVLEKKVRAEFAAKNSKAAQEEAAMKVKLAFMDDRRRKLLRDELEKERRAAVASSSALPETQQISEKSEEIHMPGSGHIIDESRIPGFNSNVVD